MACHLRYVISSVGMVFDAFIPASSGRGRATCFGFVRLGHMEAAMKGVKMMNE